MKRKPITAAMAGAIAEINEHGGELVRHETGYWSYPGCPLAIDGIPRWFIGERTVAALHERGLLQFTEHRDARPIRARAVPMAALTEGRTA